MNQILETYVGEGDRLTKMNKEPRGKKTKVTFRPDNDVADLLLRALDATGEDKTRLFNDALRVGLPDAVRSILKQQQKELEKRKPAADEFLKKDKNAN